MEPQKILIHSSQRGKGLFEQADHSDKGIKIGDIPTLVIVWEKSAVPKPMRSEERRVGKECGS